MSEANKSPLDSSSAKKPFRVLSLDGGGMRGLYTASMLAALERRFAALYGKKSLDVGKGFDLIVGTSTGSILALGLAKGLPVSKIVELYRQNGPKIFPRPVPSGWRILHWAIRHRTRPAFSSEPLRNALQALFGSLTMAELYDERHIAICIPSVSLASMKGWVFKTPHQPRFHRDDQCLVVEVCLASAAAPILFSPASMKYPDDPAVDFHLCDGGLWANNPVLVGIAEALSLAAPDQSIEVLSLDTAPTPSGLALAPKKSAWGLSFWRGGLKALDAALTAQSESSFVVARMIAEHLDRPVTLVRLGNPTVSPEQAPHIAIDCATPAALALLSKLGIDDGNRHYGSCHQGAHDGQFLGSLFSAMPEMASSQTNPPGTS